MFDLIFKQIEKSWETDFASTEEYDANSLLTQPEILGVFNQTILENKKLIELSSVNPEGVTKDELDRGKSFLYNSKKYQAITFWNVEN